MMAKAFQKMLQEFRLTRTILSVDANNASTNGMQTTKLDELDNSFNKENCICCFNHTMQLSAKALLKPSTSVLSGKQTNDDEMANTEIEDPDGLLMEEDNDNEDEVNVKNGVTNHGEEDDFDDSIDELAELGEDKQTRLLEEIAAVCQAVSKVRIDKWHQNFPSSE